MCGLVLPIVACISATISTGNVRVTVEIVIAIDSDIVVAPQPAPHPQPPLQAAPMATPTPKEIAIPAA
jgi:hypothetical protein